MSSDMQACRTHLFYWLYILLGGKQEKEIGIEIQFLYN